MTQTLRVESKKTRALLRMLRKTLRQVQANGRFAAHQAVDPHCTCNDCMSDFIAGQE